MVKIGETKRLTPKVDSLVELKVEGHHKGVMVIHDIGGLYTGIYLTRGESKQLKAELVEYLENSK